MQKVVITGCNGLLGQTLVDLLIKGKEYTVVGISRGENRTDRNDFIYESVDITDKSQLQKCIEKHQPDFIVNTAAMTNVDACEDDKEGCLKLNVTAVEYLIDLCAENDIHLVHISTDFIFDGKQGYYKETDQANPLSYYGWSKLESENLLTNSNISYSILRTILVYGKVKNMTRNNIVLWVKEMLENKKEITIVDDQFRMPTYVEDLALACKLSIDKKAKGIFNISSSELFSIFEIAKQIAQVFGLDSSYIKPISTSTLNQKAARPPKTGFNLDKTRNQLGLQPKTFKEDLQKFKEILK